MRLKTIFIILLIICLPTIGISGQVWLADNPKNPWIVCNSSKISQIEAFSYIKILAPVIYKNYLSEEEANMYKLLDTELYGINTDSDATQIFYRIKIELDHTLYETKEIKELIDLGLLSRMKKISLVANLVRLDNGYWINTDRKRYMTIARKN